MQTKHQQKKSTTAMGRDKSSASPTADSARQPTSPTKLGAFYAAGNAFSGGGLAGLQFKCAECEAQQQNEEQPTEQTIEPIQEKCAACEAEDSNDAGVEEQHNTQLQEDSTPARETEADTDSMVQMWDCTDYEKPKCAVQKKEDDLTQSPDQADENGEAVQAKCAACEADQQADTEAASAPSVQTKPGPGQPSAQPPKSPSATPSPPRQSIHHLAKSGLAHASRPLPHYDRIQAAFGRHDVSGVRTEVGGAAGQASKKMGALAYTSGDKIGFRHNPDIKLAAHEAAHTVQQRSGLKLPGNRGQRGDRWERHADAVADAVATGQSAEPLLDQVAPSPTSVSKPSPAAAAGSGLIAAVQPKLTSSPTYHIESEVDPQLPLPADEEGVEGEGEGESGDSDAVEEAAENTEENQPNPAEDCKKANQDNKKGDDKKKPDKPTGGGDSGDAEAAAEKARARKGECYYSATDDPPDGAKEPAKDSKPNDSKGKAEVKYGKWEEPNDACDCPAKDLMAKEPGGGEDESPLSVKVAEPGPNESAGAGKEGGEKPASEEPANTETAVADENAQGGGGGFEVGDFSQNEASRAAAVAKFDTASAEAGRVPARAEKLAKGLRFQNVEKGSTAVEARRTAALRQIQGFMQKVTGQIDDAVAYVTRDAPQRLGATADAVNAGIETAMTREKGLITDRINTARTNAIEGARTTREAIEKKYNEDVGLVNRETDTALDTLNNTHRFSSLAVWLGETLGLSEVNRRFTDGRQAHKDDAKVYADRAIATGNNWVDKYDHCRAGPGNDNKYNNDDGFWDGCLTVRRAQAQQKAACSTSEAFAKNMLDMGDKKGFELRDQRTQHRCLVIAGARKAQGTLDSTLERLTSGLESGRKGTLAGLAEVRRMNLEGVNAALSGTLQSLAQQERAQRQAVNDSGYVQQVAIEEMTHQIAASLAEGVTKAMESLEENLQELREQVAKGDAPAAGVLKKTLRKAEKELSGGVGTLLDKMTAGAEQAERRIFKAGTDADAALKQITTGNEGLAVEAEGKFTGQMTAITGAVNTAMTELSGRQVTKAQESAKQGSESMVNVAVAFVGSLKDVYTKADDAIKASRGELDKDLKNAELGLEPKIAAEAWRAASKEQPAWKAVVAIILIVLIVILSVVVSIFTAGLATGPMAALTLIVIGAVVGAITAGLIQIINNWAAGEEWDKDLVKAVVMGAVGGALGGAFGAGANGLAQAALQGAVRAGYSTVARAAINVGINLAGDLAGEAATQAFGYVVYGDQFKLDGFLMAGGMSVLSTARGGITGNVNAKTGAVDVKPPLADMSAAGRRAKMAQYGTDAAIGMGFGLAVEGAYMLGGGEFNLNRFASSAAGAGMASRSTALAEDFHNVRQKQRGAQSGTDVPETTPPRTPGPDDAPDTTPPRTPTPEDTPDTPPPREPTPDDIPDTPPPPREPTPENIPDAPPRPREPAPDETPDAPPKQPTPENTPDTPPPQPQPKRPVPAGQAAAAAKNYEAVPKGYHWVVKPDGTVTPQRSPGSKAANNPPISYNEKTRTFTPTDPPPAGYRWVAKPSGGYSVNRKAGGKAANNPPLKYDAKTGTFAPALEPPPHHSWKPTENGGYALTKNSDAPADSPSYRFDGSKDAFVETGGQTQTTKSPPSGDGDVDVSNTRTNHQDAPEIEPGVVAKRTTEDGHNVSVLKDGRIIVCSTCGDIRMKYATELSDPNNLKLRQELDRITGIRDPDVKADAAARLREKLELNRGGGTSTRPATETAAALAQAAGLPPAPRGYHWAKNGSGVVIKRNAGGIAENNPPLRYDAESRSLVPAIEPPPHYHWARKPNGGYTLKRYANAPASANSSHYRFDAASGTFVDLNTGQVFRPPQGSPLGGNSIIADAQVGITAVKDAQGVGLQPGAETNVKNRLDQLKAAGVDDLRFADVAASEIRTGALPGSGIQLTTTRNSREYRKVMGELVRANVGRTKGVNDRAIVADAFFAQTTGGNPTLITADKGVYNNLFRLSGGNPAALGQPVPQAHPNGFNVTVGGKTITVIPIGG